MRPRILRDATAVWAALIGLTFFSLAVAERLPFRSAAIVAIFGIAVLKAELVMVRYMEVGDAPQRWRALYQGWAVVVGVMLAAGSL